jgi:NTP pyrophosphatase (non-canonical NTP hydrolase)
MDKYEGTKFKSISLPRLNNLKPNIESTALKLMEEAGELAQLIGKYRGLNGENCKMEESQVVGRIAEELLDVAQVAVSMMFVLEESYSVDIQEKINNHIEKLIRKGYMKG